MENQNKNITPSQYFDYIKNAKNEITVESIKESFSVFVKLAEKYKKLGQKESLKKLCFLANVLQKEEKLIELGITTFIYKDTIEDYIETVSNEAVKIVELSRYMREIPDELVDTIVKTSEIFDEFYVVFTDYTGKIERQVEKERMDKDPILFGVFKNDNNVADRFYFIGDWIDEYCDLTLDKMVEQYSKKKGYSPTNVINVPNTTEELIETLKTYKIGDKDSNYKININDEPIPINNFRINNEPKERKHKKSFFDKVCSIFKK